MRVTQSPPPIMRAVLWLPVLFISVLLVLVAQVSFLTFHTLVELFAIIISFLMFTLVWSIRDMIRNSFLLFLGCGYFWVGSLDLLHTLTYKGMDLLVHDHGNVSIQFWICARFLEAMTLMLAPFMINQSIREGRIFILFGLVSVAATLTVYFQLIPNTFIEGQGLTPFKIYSEYLIDLILAVALWCLYHQGRDLPTLEKQLIAVSIVMTMIAELAFTFYVSFYGLSNLIGHLFKLCSFWMILHAIIASNLRKPYKDLQISENRFRRLFENSEVSLWNVNLTPAYHFIQRLKLKQHSDFETYLELHSAELKALARQVHVTEVNSATLHLFQVAADQPLADQEKDLLSCIPLSLFKKQLLAMWTGEEHFRAETVCWTLQGERINTIISMQLPQRARDFNNLPISIIDITQRKQDEQRIWQQANFDSLTGLANRSYFTDSMSHAIDLAERQQERLALLYIDLDRFKQVNDTLGHAVGDQLLKSAAQRLNSCLRKTDLAARLAGDEFAVLLPNISAPEAIEPLVSELLLLLAQPYEFDGNDSIISASIGVAIYPDDGTQVEELLRKADSAMYKAKEDGRNHYHFFTLEIEQEALRKRTMEQDLRNALLNDEFTLHYQPINDLQSHTASAEALIRWQHPTRGMISPIEFIPFAEELGLIVPLGEWILRQACAEAVTWAETSESPPRVAVNLSCKQFLGQDMPALLEEVLQETGLPPSRLILEITESLLIDDDESTLGQLLSIRAMGIDLAIDDFGTGYSSLSYLKKFPVTYLKIDRSFIMGLPHNSEDKALVNAIISMAQSLKLKIVAEGVETSEQALYLQSYNCSYIQGYFLSRPLPAEEFRQFIANKD